MYKYKKRVSTKAIHFSGYSTVVFIGQPLIFFLIIKAPFLFDALLKNKMYLPSKNVTVLFNFLE